MSAAHQAMFLEKNVFKGERSYTELYLDMMEHTGKWTVGA